MDITILVVTCYKFRQVWNPFFTLFKKYWPDCPYEVIMVTDIGTYNDISTIQKGSDCGWSSNLIHALQQIKTDKVIIFQEDFLLTDFVDTEKVKKLVQYSIENDIGCLRLCPCPGPTSIWKDNFLGIIGTNDDYRVSLQLAVWDLDVLKSLLKEGESAWDLETKGKERSKTISKPFLSLWRQPDDTPGGPVPYFITAVTRGVWENGALELLQQERIPMDNITKRII